MSTTGTRERPQVDGWPVRLDGARLRVLLGGLGIATDGASLIHSVAGAAGPPTGDRTSAERVMKELGVSRELLVRALRILAAPRQLLVLTRRADDLRMLFLHDGELLVRADVGSEGCTLSAPHDHGQLAALVSDAVGPPPAASIASVTVGRRFLAALEALREAGWASRELSVTEAEAALATTLPVGVDVPACLEALQNDGVIEIEGSRVVAAEAWLSEHRYLTEPPELELQAVEAGDVLDDLVRARAMLVLAGRRHLAYLPMSSFPEEVDALVGLTHVGPGSVQEAVALLLAPVAMPPVTPQRDYEGDPAEWIGELSGDVARPPTGEVLPWTVDAPEAIQPVLGMVADGVPSALFAPGATIEVVVASGSRGLPERTVLALAPDGAVEWTPRGSRVAWRALDVAAVASRVRELLPLHDGRPADASGCVVSADVLARLVGGATLDVDDVDVPETLRPLMRSPDTVWSTVWITTRSAGLVRGEVLLLADGPHAPPWRFEPDGEIAYAATRTGPEELVRDLLGALRVG